MAPPSGDFIARPSTSTGSGRITLKLQRKRLRLELKDGPDQAGSFVAGFSKYDEIDLDEDVPERGSFEDGAPVRIGSYGHKLEQLPTGRGALVAKADAPYAYVEGKFFLNTTVGTDTYETVKAMGDLQEWSYVYDILKYHFGEKDGRQVRFLTKQKVHSVDPVFLGAGIETHTVAIKGAKGERSYNDVRSILEGSLREIERPGGTAGDNWFLWVEDFFDDRVVYSASGDPALYERSYVIDAAGAATFGDATEVQRHTEYLPKALERATAEAAYLQKLLTAPADPGTQAMAERVRRLNLHRARTYAFATT